MPSRRAFLAVTAAWLLIGCHPEAPATAAPHDLSGHAVADLEKKLNGRFGVFALDTGTGRSFAWRADERFAMCSVFKWLLAAVALEAAERKQLSLDEPLRYGASDLLEHSPVTEAHVTEGALTIEQLAEAAVTLSDNTAANLLLARLGGPSAVTAFARKLGDAHTRLDRNEPSLNENLPGDRRDSTTPRAMVGAMRAALLGEALSADAQKKLIGWMLASTTGPARLRAGFPTEWSVADKTGTGANGAANDVALVHRPGRAPLLIAAFASDGPASLEARNAGIAEIARWVAQSLE